MVRAKIATRPCNAKVLEIGFSNCLQKSLFVGNFLLEMGYVGQNRSWTKKTPSDGYPVSLKSKDFLTIWSTVLHARHLVLHLWITVDERSQLSWVLGVRTRLFLLCPPSPFLNVNNRWRCDLPTYFYTLKKSRIVRHLCNFCNFC